MKAGDGERGEADEEAGSSGSGKEAESASGGGEDEGEDDEGGGDAGTAGADGDADGEFATAVESADEEQIGDVDGGDEPDETDGGEEDEEGEADAANEVGVKGVDEGLDGGIGLGIGACEPGGDAIEVGLGLGEGDAGLEAGDGGDFVITVVGEEIGRVGSGEIEGDRIGETELEGGKEGRGHDADDLVGLAIEANGAGEDVGVGGKAGLPEFVAEDDHRSGAGGVFAGREVAAEEGGDAECGEEVGGGAVGEEAFGGTGFGEVDALEAIAGDGREGLVEALVIEEVGGRDRTAGVIFRFDERDQSVGVGVREGAEDDGVDDAEDGGIDADAEGEGKDDDGGESGIAGDIAKAMAKILEEDVEVRQGALPAAGFFGLEDATELPACFQAGIGGRQAGAKEVLLEEFDVVADLIGEGLVELSFAEEGEEAVHETPSMSR